MQGLIVGGLVALVGTAFAWAGTVRSQGTVHKRLSQRSRVWFGGHPHRVEQVVGGLVVVLGLLLATGIVPLG